MLALRVAMETPGAVALRCAVDFFGPTTLLDNQWSKLPPVLIFEVGSPAELVARLHAELAGEASP